MPALGVGERAKVCAERDAEMTARHFPSETPVCRRAWPKRRAVAVQSADPAASVTVDGV